jgi:hypothetical protein
MYAYYWVHTAAQLELIACDVPLVVYDKPDREDRKHSKKEMDDLVKRWQEKKERERKEGKEFNFSEYINTPVDNFKNE